MESMNLTHVKEFILVGFPQNMHICVVFFMVLLLAYIFTIFGNVFLIVAVIVSSQLHLPMYFFLCNLSVLDICFSSSTLPKAMIDMFSLERTISIGSCIVQMNVGSFLGSTESLLLALMAYDRYVAICSPLYYNIIMNWNMCRTMISIMWPVNYLLSILPIISRPLSFCRENKLDHFVCEMLAVLELACGNLAYFKLTILFACLLTFIVPLVFIMVSYVLIMLSIVKIQSTDGRTKAFSTCASHLIVVCMFYGTTITVYMGQTKSFFPYLKYISLTYGVFTPMLNPLIYSLRNNDVKEAFKKILKKFFHNSLSQIVSLNF